MINARLNGRSLVERTARGGCFEAACSRCSHRAGDHHNELVVVPLPWPPQSSSWLHRLVLSRLLQKTQKPRQSRAAAKGANACVLLSANKLQLKKKLSFQKIISERGKFQQAACLCRFCRQPFPQCSLRKPRALAHGKGKLPAFGQLAGQQALLNGRVRAAGPPTLACGGFVRFTRSSLSHPPCSACHLLCNCLKVLCLEMFFF